MPAKSYADRRAVLTALSNLGHAPFNQIAAAMGPEWQAPNRVACLRQLLRKMERDGLVMHVGANLYMALHTPAWGGFGPRDGVICAISTFLADCDGSVPICVVQESFTSPRIWGPCEGEDQLRYILEILHGSPCFQLDASGTECRLIPAADGAAGAGVADMPRGQSAAPEGERSE